MLDRLPYELTKDVTATREGLRIGIRNQPAMASLLSAIGRSRIYTGMQTVFPWEYLKPVLRYRKGEPWCAPVGGGIVCGMTNLIDQDRDGVLLRLAAILCDDAEAFRVFHWCIHNLPERKESNE